LAVFFLVFTESTLHPTQRHLIIKTLIIAGCDAIVKFKVRHKSAASLQISPRVKGYKGIDMIVQLPHTETRQVWHCGDSPCAAGVSSVSQGAKIQRINKTKIPVPGISQYEYTSMGTTIIVHRWSGRLAIIIM